MLRRDPIVYVHHMLDHAKEGGLYTLLTVLIKHVI